MPQRKSQRPDPEWTSSRVLWLTRSECPFIQKCSVRSKPRVVFKIMSSYEVLNLLLDEHHPQNLLTDTF